LNTASSFYLSPAATSRILRYDYFILTANLTLGRNHESGTDYYHCDHRNPGDWRVYPATAFVIGADVRYATAIIHAASHAKRSQRKRDWRFGGWRSADIPAFISR
jgi:hypothetical protein